ncbi:hypothetical protein FJT64_003548 [Amphibalanus amphitrite]|uniref:Uncharacterized protein n=1 Tax=Amphibalanus amphitrite TaxID=1232801 RepID=A0A6A4W1Q0_AMPAM|nr:hypothetical protein FJT64_003548 [Amphibalanus amphitrite]
MYNKLQECELDLSGKAELISRLQARSWEVGRLLSGLQQLGGSSRTAAPAPAMRPSRSAHTLQEALRRAPAVATPPPPSPRDDVTPTPGDVIDDVSEGVANRRMEAECGLTPQTPDTPRSEDQEHSMDGWETIDGDEI